MMETRQVSAMPFLTPPLCDYQKILVQHVVNSKPSGMLANLTTMFVAVPDEVHTFAFAGYMF
jgi:hypothetical protein